MGKFQQRLLFQSRKGAFNFWDSTAKCSTVDVSVMGPGDDHVTVDVGHHRI